MNEEKMLEDIRYASSNPTGAGRLLQELRQENLELKIIIKQLGEIVDEDTEKREKLVSDIDGLEKKINYWSFCTQTGMLQHCPEKADELREFLAGLNIHPYQSLDKPDAIRSKESR